LRAKARYVIVAGRGGSDEKQATIVKGVASGHNITPGPTVWVKTKGVRLLSFKSRVEGWDVVVVEVVDLGTDLRTYLDVPQSG